MVAGGVCAVEWPKVMSALVLVPFSRWRELEESSHRMRTARAICSSVVSLSIHRPMSWVAACSAWALGWLALPFDRV